MKKLLIFFMTAVMVFSAVGTVFAADAQTGDGYRLANAGGYDRFSNYVDGYELLVDAGMKVDMRYSDVAAILENATKRIEIYKQDLSHVSREGYINYSNKFLTNTTDHYGIVQHTESIGGYDVKVTAWERAKLARVQNDKNYYVCLEIDGAGCIYTIFVKSSVPIGENGGYRYLAEDFRTMAETASGSIRVSKPVKAENRGWNEETYGFYQEYLSDDASLSWGIFEPEVDYFGYDRLNQYEREFNYKFPVILSYTEVVNTSVETVRERLEDAYARGKIVELTLQTAQSADGNMVYRLLSGEYDNYLYNYAKTVRDFGHPVLFRLFNEMNGDWCPYAAYNTSKDTQIFQDAYRYIHEIFERCGANRNTIWIWNPNSVSYPNFNWNHALMYYPGDRYVDVVGMTAYNTGTYYEGENWQSFAALYNDLYDAYSVWFAQPLMITEFASSSVGGNKAAWIDDMFSRIRGMERIKLAIWWDGCDYDANGAVARPYFLDETTETLRAFRRGLIKPGVWYTDIFA